MAHIVKTIDNVSISDAAQDYPYIVQIYENKVQFLIPAPSPISGPNAWGFFPPENSGLLNTVSASRENCIQRAVEYNGNLHAFKTQEEMFDFLSKKFPKK